MLIRPAIISADAAQMISIIAALITLPFMDQARISRVLSKLRKKPNSATTKINKRGPIVIGMTVGSIICGKFILLPRLDNLIALTFAAILIIAAIVSLSHAIKQHREHTRLLMESQWRQIVVWEQQILIIFCIPIFTARLISLCGTLSVINSQSIASNFIYFFTRVALLLALKPSRSSFLGVCANCKAPVPIAFVEYGSCLNCNQESHSMQS